MNALGYRQRSVSMGMGVARSQRMAFDRKDIAIFRALFHLTLVAMAVVFLFFLVGCDEGWETASSVSGHDQDGLETVLPPTANAGLFEFNLDDLLS